jgi:hypothetical protein
MRQHCYKLQVVSSTTRAERRFAAATRERRKLGFQRVHQGHQLLHLRHDPLLLGKGRNHHFELLHLLLCHMEHGDSMTGSLNLLRSILKEPIEVALVQVSSDN